MWELKIPGSKQRLLLLIGAVGLHADLCKHDYPKRIESFT